LASKVKTSYMKLKLTLLGFCLFCVGIFSHAQDKKARPSKPAVEEGADPIPVTVTSKKRHSKPIAIQQYDKDGNLLPPPPPPPKIERARFAPPKIVKDDQAPPLPPKQDKARFDPPKIEKDGDVPPPPPPKPGKGRFAPPRIVKDRPAPPPPPVEQKKNGKPVSPDAPPAADERT
jgi:hypothetical protein